MSEAPVSPATPRPGAPMTSTELVNTVSHFHRAEIARMTGWRDRLDTTTNWALTVAAAMLSVSLSSPDSHHGVLLFGMVLTLVLLWIETRRYRFFDVYRSRVRQFERHYFAQIFSPQKSFASDWLLFLGESLRRPKFLITKRVAFARRLKRNYVYIFLILLAAWLLKILTPNLQDEGSRSEFVHSLFEAMQYAQLGFIPGQIVVSIVAVFYAGLAGIVVFTRDDDTEFADDDVHV